MVVLALCRGPTEGFILAKSGKGLIHVFTETHALNIVVAFPDWLLFDMKKAIMRRRNDHRTMSLPAASQRMQDSSEGGSRMVLPPTVMLSIGGRVSLRKVCFPSVNF
jgi:hypothetical protein